METLKDINLVVTTGEPGVIADIMASEERMLYDRKSAALQLSISVRSLDYLISKKELAVRRMGKKILIPHAELVKFARKDHKSVAPDLL
jgi:hypothetical protein